MTEDPNAPGIPGEGVEGAEAPAPAAEPAQVIEDTPTPPVAADPAAAAVGDSASALHEDIDQIEGGLTFELKKAKQLIDEAVDWVKKHFERVTPADGVDTAD